jgi:hypothetical protein
VTPCAVAGGVLIGGGFAFFFDATQLGAPVYRSRRFNVESIDFSVRGTDAHSDEYAERKGGGGLLHGGSPLK